MNVPYMGLLVAITQSKQTIYYYYYYYYYYY